MKTENLQKFGIYLLLCFVVMTGREAFAQRGGFSPDMIFDRMDANGDGRLDERELGSSRMGEFLQRAGVDTRRGLDRQGLSQAFERLRAMRESGGGPSRGGSEDRGRGGFGGGPPGGFDRSRFSRGEDDRDRRDDRDRDRRDDRGRDDDRRREESEQRRREEEQRRTGVAPIRPKERVTVDLPTTFEEGDMDRDGQIGFYEWKRWKRDAIGEFATYDYNGDGFLTPRELARGPSEAANTVVASIQSTNGQSASVESRSQTSTESGEAERSDTGETPTYDANSVAARRGESMFRLLDRDRDESLSGDEWNRARTIKPLFEKGGVDLSQPMSKNEFVANYIRLSES